MILGRLPFLRHDRTGVALLGAIALVATGDLTPEQAAHRGRGQTSSGQQTDEQRE